MIAEQCHFAQWMQWSLETVCFTLNWIDERVALASNAGQTPTGFHDCGSTIILAKTLVYAWRIVGKLHPTTMAGRTNEED
jgi:hypothetical protein